MAILARQPQPKYMAKSGITIDVGRTAPTMLTTLNSMAVDLFSLEEGELIELAEEVGKEWVVARRRAIEATAIPPIKQ